MALEKSVSMEANLQTLSCEEPEEEPKIKNRSLCTKAKLIFLNITVEPILVLYVIPSMMSSLAMQNLNLEKACRVNYKFDNQICDALTQRNRSGYTDETEQAVQKLVASMNAYKNIVQSLLPSILLIFLGSWSDRHKRRKPCIVLPIIGEAISVAGFIISVYFFYELPLQFNTFCEAVPPGMTGGWFTVFMGVFSYISGISSVETRTLRIGAVNLFSNISLTIGIALSGILYNKLGFYGVFFLSLSMHFLALIYANVRVKEKAEAVENKKGFLRDFFDLNHIRDTLNVAFKKGKRNRRKRICIIMILVMVIIGPMHGK